MPQSLAERLTLKHLRLIAAIAEHRQLSLAAQVLSLTQPAASRSLAEIEALCGGPIFERHARGMRPTPLGQLVVRRAQNVLDEIGGAADELARYRSGRGGSVRIGAVTGGAIGYIVPVLQRLRAEAPGTEIHVDVAMSRELVRDLLAMRVDFALARLPPEANAGAFEVVRASGEVVELIVGAGHPAAALPQVRLADLLDGHWIMQSSGAPIRVAVEDALLAQGERPPLRITNTSSLLVTLAMLATPDAVAPVSREVANLLVGAGTRSGIVALPLAERILVPACSLLSLSGRRLSPVAQRCHDMVAAELAAGGAKG